MLKFILTLVILLLPVSVKAQSPTSPDTAYLSSALAILNAISTPEEQKLFNGLTFKPITGENAPLARYTPTNQGSIEIGQNFKQYQKEFLVLSTAQDRHTRSDFSQYMTVLTILSLANESAHRVQDLNGSLNDFFDLLKSHDIEKACTLYALQQQASDIVMMVKAVRLYEFFKKMESAKGLSALQMALDKMELLVNFQEFYTAINRPQEQERINNVIETIRVKRAKINLQSLEFCQTSRIISLPDDVIARAQEPAKKALTSPPLSNTHTSRQHFNE